MIPPTWMLEELRRRRQEREQERPRLRIELELPVRSDDAAEPARRPGEPIVIVP